MLFIETPLFTKLIQELAPDENYRLLQQTLILRPETGDLIQGGGGLRKIRWKPPGRGKRGGLRVIYYWDVSADTIYMLLPYPKNKQEDLTQAQLKMVTIHLVTSPALHRSKIASILPKCPII